MPPTRLGLYRAAARALNRFFSRWTSPFCERCLDVTRRHHRGDPRTEVDLVEGLFPGCCQAGVADALWVPGGPDEGRFPPGLRSDMESARAGLNRPPPDPASYTVRERGTGRIVRGVACAELGAGGCRLGELKAPLCVIYLCDPARAALAGVAGWDLVGGDTDDFCGSRAALRAVVAGPLGRAELEVGLLEARLDRLHERLEICERETGQTPFEVWSGAHPSSARSSSPATVVR